MEWQNKRKPTDRTLDPKVVEKVPDADLFQRMQEVESNLDALVQRKRLDLQDMIGRSMRKHETLRIFVSSSVFNQPWQEGTPLYVDGGKPQWTLRIEGRLVNSDPEKSRAFSSMITSVIVELHREGTNEDLGDAMEGVEPSAPSDESKDASADAGSAPPSEAPVDTPASVPAPGSVGASAEASRSNSPLGPQSAQGTPVPGDALQAQAQAPPGDTTSLNTDPSSAGVASSSGSPSVQPGSTPAVPTPSASSAPTSGAPDGTPKETAGGDVKQESGSENDAEEIVEWHEACVPAEQRVDFDGLDVKRTGSTPVNAKILIQLKEYPDKFKLSPQLANILGVDEESKPGAVVSLWQYIRYHKLQDVDEKRMIRCNGPLFNLFKREKIMFPQLVELLGPHLSPREPVTIEYTINPGQDVGNRDIAFDVPIQVDHPLRSELLTMLNSWHHDTGSINKLEDLILQDVQALNLLAHQHDFYTELSNDPITFLERWVRAQARDLKILYCDRQFSEEAVRHSSFYSDDLLNPSLHLFLGRQ